MLVLLSTSDVRCPTSKSLARTWQGIWLFGCWEALQADIFLTLIKTEMQIDAAAQKVWGRIGLFPFFYWELGVRASISVGREANMMLPDQENLFAFC